MSYQGRRVGPLYRVADSALERNRLVTIDKVTKKSAYAGPGAYAEGYTFTRGDESSVSVNRLDYLDGTLMLKVGNRVAVGDPLVPVSNGIARAKDYSVKNRITASAPGTPSTGDTYLVPAAGWGSAHGNAVAIYGDSAWVYVDMGADTIDTVIFDESEKTFYTWNGTAWVLSKVAAYANEPGYLNAEIECLKVSILPTEMRGQIVAMGTKTANEAATTITITDSRAKAGDLIFASLTAYSSAAYILKAVCTTDGTITVTTNTAPGNATATQYIILRAIA